MQPARQTHHLKPLARARTTEGLDFRRGVPVLTLAMEERLFRVVDVLSEGESRTDERGRPRYFGSTMLRFDLEALRPSWRGAFGPRQRGELKRAVEGSVRVHLRATRLAYAEVVRRVPDSAPGTAEVDTRVRLEGPHLHIDVDLEVPLKVSS